MILYVPGYVAELYKHTRINMEDKFLESLRKNWIFIVAFFFMSAAWGQAQYKIQNLEQAVKSNAEVQTQVIDLKVQNARVEEQLKTVKESQKTQEQLLREIASNVAKIRK